MQTMAARWPMNTLPRLRQLYWWPMGAWLIASAIVANPAAAVPPLVTGDVPTADKNHVEVYVGTRYQKTDSIERQLPFTEIVYGLTERQEITFEIPYLSVDGQHGFGDAVLGTKYLILRETDQRPGIAGSFELKLDNGDASKGLGTGALEYDFRPRAQKTFDWFTGLINAGYTITDQRDVVFLAFAQEYRVSAKLALLSEIYWRNSAEPGEPNRFAGDVGFKYHLVKHLDVHAAVGKSARSANRGGPALRVYAGIKLEF
jgi:Putative MetA-pathway of phenol degradation